MKAEKRHQLQTNVLADSVGRMLQSMKSTPRNQSTLVWVFVVLAVGTIVLWQYGAHATQARYSTLWTEVDVAASDPVFGGDKLRKFAQENPGTLPGRSARFQVARVLLQNGQEGIRNVLSRDEAAKQTYQARTAYMELAKECLDVPLLIQEAMMGIAQAEETLIGVPANAVAEMPVPSPNDPDTFDLKGALASYQRLADKYPSSILGKSAAERVKAIKDNEQDIEIFYKDLNYWAKLPKDQKPKMDIPGLPEFPTPILPPSSGTGSAGPDLPLKPEAEPVKKATPAKTESATQKLDSVPAPKALSSPPKAETKPPAPKDDIKVITKPEKKDSKSK